VNRLNVALKNQGENVGSASKDLQKFANELQKTTTISDEAALNVMGLLTSFGLTGEKLKSTTKAAADLSKGLGIDLNSAAMLLAKSYAGNTDALSRYGIKIDEAIPKGQKFAAVMEQVNSRFGGAAQAALNTTSGRIENMGNRIDDLKEKIGGQLLPVLDYWLKKLDQVLKVVMGYLKNSVEMGKRIIQ
jgi:ABC-type transporter Mla subunit MlaD